MRLTIEGTSLIDCGGNIADLGKEEYSRRYSEKSVLAHAKLGQIEDILDKYGIADPQTLDEILRQYKYLGDHDYRTLPKGDFDALFAELARYKEIEKEFKIDLITLFKALKNGIWRKKFNKIWYVEPENLYIDNEMTFYRMYGESIEAIANYNDKIFKWALTKEELE